MTRKKMTTAKKIVLPAFGAHMVAYSELVELRVGRREQHSAPFPRCTTEDEVMEIVDEITNRGFLLLDMKQHKVTISKGPKSGLIVHTEGEPDYKMSVKALAKGTVSSKIWFTKADYKFFYPSWKVMREEDQQAAAFTRRLKAAASARHRF